MGASTALRLREGGMERRIVRPKAVHLALNPLVRVQLATLPPANRNRQPGMTILHQIVILTEKISAEVRAGAVARAEEVEAKETGVVESGGNHGDQNEPGSDG